jgi:hypothetical protein
VRSRWVCGVPCPGGARGRSARTGSGIRYRIHARSTHQPRGLCVAAFRRSRLSICLVAVPSAGRCRLHGRSSPDPRSRLPDRVDTSSGSCRCRAAARRRLTDSSCLCPTAPARSRAAPGGAQQNHRAPVQSGRGAIRCPGSLGGSSIKQNRFTLGWQAIFRISAESGYTQSMVKWLRYKHQIPALPPPDGTLSVRQVCDRYGVSHWVVYYWIEIGLVTATRRNPTTRYAITMTDKIDKRLRQWIANSCHLPLQSPRQTA